MNDNIYRKEIDNINNANAQLKANEENNAKVLKFKERIQAFANVKTIDEARELIKKILPVANKINKFKIGNAVCTVINDEKMLRISIDAETEFISYNFE